MATTIIVKTEDVLKAADQIREQADDYKAQYDALYNETDAMASAWKGEDNLAYTNQIAGFKDDFGKMYQLMHDYADFLTDAAKTYEATQTTVIANAKKLIN